MNGGVQVEHLRKSYGAYVAVDGISFEARAGQVTGFLGPNGSGKSTTLRMIVGLTPPTSGTATIGGRRFVDVPNPGTRVGVMLDASAQHAGRTGREVLTVGALTMGLPRRRVDEVLELAGLTPAESRRRVGNYSLGMRQRLGIAHTLLAAPRTLILDEPANGLDPAGIRWLRGLLRRHADGGGTVLLSSHLLTEVQAVADHIVVLGEGRIAAQGATSQLLGATGSFVAVDDRDRLATLLRDAGLGVTLAGAGLHVEADPEQVGHIAAGAGIGLRELRPAEAAGLEELFLRLTADTQRDRSQRPEDNDD